MPMICSSDLATMKWLNLQNNGKFLPRAVIETRAHYQPDLLHLLELCLGPAKVGGLAAKPGSAKRTNTTSVLGNHTVKGYGEPKGLVREQQQLRKDWERMLDCLSLGLCQLFECSLHTSTP